MTKVTQDSNRFARRVATSTRLFATASLFLLACGNDSKPMPILADSGADVDMGSDDPDPTLTNDERATLATLSPADLPSAPADSTNEYSDDPGAARLGQRFFYDPIFSGKLTEGDNTGDSTTLGKKGEVGKVACAGCHVAAAGFLDNRSQDKEISLGAGWGKRRTPSLLDVGQTKILMWDGRHDALYNQPFGPIESAVEMNSSRLYTAEQIFIHYRTEYTAVFGAKYPLPPLDDGARFPPLSAELTGCQPSTVDPPAGQPCNGTQHGMPGDQAEFDGMTPADQDAVTRVVVNFGKALAAYERLLTCGQGRFDRWMQGQANALSRSEQRGAEIFVRTGCATCHSGPFLSDQKFHNVGLRPAEVATVFLDANDPGAATGLQQSLADPLNTHGKYSDADDGRLSVTIDPSMSGAFRTPMLRCVARRPSLMHTGQYSRAPLLDVVAFFNGGGQQGGYIGTSELRGPLNLSAREQADLTAFLGTLEGAGPAANLLGPPAQP